MRRPAEPGRFASAAATGPVAPPAGNDRTAPSTAGRIHARRPVRPCLGSPRTSRAAPSPLLNLPVEILRQRPQRPQRPQRSPYGTRPTPPTPGDRVRHRRRMHRRSTPPRSVARPHGRVPRPVVAPLFGCGGGGVGCGRCRRGAGTRPRPASTWSTTRPSTGRRRRVHKPARIPTSPRQCARRAPGERCAAEAVQPCDPSAGPPIHGDTMLNSDQRTSFRGAPVVG